MITLNNINENAPNNAITPSSNQTLNSFPFDDTNIVELLACIHHRNDENFWGDTQSHIDETRLHQDYLELQIQAFNQEHFANSSLEEVSAEDRLMTYEEAIQTPPDYEYAIKTLPTYEQALQM